MLFLSGCEKKEEPLCNDSDPLFSHSDFPIGVAVDLDLLKFNQTYRSIVVNQFNSITPANIFKAYYIHPSETYFDWSESDYLVNFCMQNGKRLHGHVLIWHNQLPDWMRNFQGTTDQWEAMMKNHIQTIVCRYKGKIKGWDVVNEAFNEDGTLRKTVWQEHIGNDYLEKAFIYAREADPDAILFYNDFNLEINPTKLNAVLKFLNNLKSKGILIDGLGIQMHIGDNYPGINNIAGAIYKAQKNDLHVHLSEIDISLNVFGHKTAVTGDMLNSQNQTLSLITQNYKQTNQQLRYGMTFWGVGDQDSWIRSYYNRLDWPLLYDDNYLPKPCYCGLKKSL
jgi:endo-1,4-beta-xylanase